MFLGENPIHIVAGADIAPLVLMPGDPMRAKYIAEKFLTDAKLVSDIRGMFAFTGYYKDNKVTVMGSGMGMPSMSIYSFELFHFFNVEKIIRIGTCGAVSKSVDVKDLILAKNVYSETNFAYTYNDYKEHVVSCSNTLNETIINTYKELKLNSKLHVGTLTTMDVFGPYIDYERVLNRIPEYYHVLGEEMEAYGLAHVAASLNKDATTIVTVADSKYSNIVLTSEEREKSLNDMITLALEAIIK